MEYILASASPRRSELLRKIISKFQVIPSGANEDLTLYYSLQEIADLIKNSPEKIVEKLACVKSKFVLENHIDSVVIGSDTGVFFNGEMLGKPKDKDDAFRMLKLLSGKTHEVITGIAVMSANKSVVTAETTKVTFNEISDKKILEYIETGSPMDKAGGYGIQDENNIVKEIVGDYQNVMGFPIDRLSEILKNF